jgi:hypothetical protein
MKHDLLLAWMSERGSGTWQELKDAWAWLNAGTDLEPADRAWIVARDLSALGHIEIAWTQQRWAAAPPVITMLPRSGGRALMTGGRTRALYEPPHPDSDEAGTGMLADAAEELDLWVDDWPSRDGPTSAVINCTSHIDAERLASRLGIRFTYSVSQTLAHLLPPLEAYLRIAPAGELPRGFDAEVFDPEECRWSWADSTEVPGLYRCRTWGVNVYALRSPLNAWKRVQPEVGIYAVYSWHAGDLKPMTYDRASGELSMKLHAVPPLLHSRAAVLCSGRLPMRPDISGRRHIVYLNVAPEVARRIASSLGQALNEEVD